MRYLVDTGVLLRLFDKRDPQHATVYAAFRLLKSRNNELTTTPQNIREFWNVTTRPKTARGGYGLNSDQAALRLKAVERIFRVLAENADAFSIWKERVVAHQVHGVQVHDANIAAMAVYHKADFILTLNPNDMKRFLPSAVVTPSDIVAAG